MKTQRNDRECYRCSNAGTPSTRPPCAWCTPPEWSEWTPALPYARNRRVGFVVKLLIAGLLAWLCAMLICSADEVTVAWDAPMTNTDGTAVIKRGGAE